MYKRGGQEGKTIENTNKLAPGNRKNENVEESKRQSGRKRVRIEREEVSEAK